MAEPVEASSLYSDAPLFSFGVQFNVGDFLRPAYADDFPEMSPPTRVTEHSATLLDNIITNITGYCIKSGVLYNDISDHFPVLNFPTSNKFQNQ